MRKFLLALLLCAFLLALTTSLTGCKGMVTEGKMKSMIEKALEEKYNEEFECIRILPNQNPSGSYDCVCCPINNKELKFEARMHTNGQYDGDHYPTSIAARELSILFDDTLGDIWGEHFTYAYSSLGIDDDETTQKISSGGFTLEFF